MALLHQKLALVLVFVSLGGLIWAVLLVRRDASGGRIVSLGWLAVGLIALQAVAGSVLALGGKRPADASHFVLGPATLAALPLALVLRRGRTARADSLIVLAGWLVTFALCLRDLGTGGTGA